MSTKAGRVTMKDVRQGKTFWRVYVRPVLLQIKKEIRDDDERIISFFSPQSIIVSEKIAFGSLKANGFCCKQKFCGVDSNEYCNLEKYQQIYSKQGIALVEYFVSKRAALRFIKLNEKTVFNKKTIYEGNEHSVNCATNPYYRSDLAGNKSEAMKAWITKKLS